MHPPDSIPTDARLTLLGTVHRDTQGEARLAGLLERLRPHLLTVELSPYGHQYRTLQTRPLLARLERILDRLAEEYDRPREVIASHPAIVDIRALLELPFEYRAAEAYARTHGAVLKLIDLSEVSVAKLRRVESGLISYRNLRLLVQRPGEVRMINDEGYATARQLLAKEASSSLRRSFLAGKRGKEGIGPRDEVMAKEIDRLLKDRPEQRLVHIGGWVHLVDDPEGESLFSRLTAWKPLRNLLSEG